MKHNTLTSFKILSFKGMTNNFPCPIKSSSTGMCVFLFKNESIDMAFKVGHLSLSCAWPCDNGEDMLVQRLILPRYPPQKWGFNCKEVFLRQCLLIYLLEWKTLVQSSGNNRQDFVSASLYCIFTCFFPFLLDGRIKVPMQRWVLYTNLGIVWRFM